MFESLRDLYNEYLPDLLLLAAKRSKLNVRRLSQLHKAETGQGLSPAQYRDIADDMTQDALANHWERYCAYCADLDWGRSVHYELNALQVADSWLQRSKLRFRRSAVAVGAGLSKSRPDVPHVPYWALDLLSESEYTLLQLIPQCRRDRDLVLAMFGGEGGKEWNRYRALRCQLEQTLSLLVLLGKVREQSETLKPLAKQLDSLVCSSIRAGRKSAPKVDPNAAFELAQWYSRQGMISMFRCHAAENIRYHPEQVELARKVAYVEGKTRYYNLEDFKLSTSDSKRHDKRWDRVDSDLDGTEASMVRLLSNKHRGNSLLGWMFILEAINDVAKLGYGFTSRHATENAHPKLATPQLLATDGIFRDADPDEVRDCFERASLIRQYVEARVNAVSLIERATRTGEFLLRRLSEKTAVA